MSDKELILTVAKDIFVAAIGKSTALQKLEDFKTVVNIVKEASESLR